MWSVYSIQNGNQMWVFVFKRFATYRYRTYQLLLRSTEAKLTLNLHLYFQVCRNTYKRWSDVRKCPICWELGNELCYVANRLRCQTFRGRENVFDSVWCFVVIRMATLQTLGSGCVAQLVERSLPIPEVRGSNPVIGKNLFKWNICLLSTVYWNDESKEKRGREWPNFFLKKTNSPNVNVCNNCCQRWGYLGDSHQPKVHPHNPILALRWHNRWPVGPDLPKFCHFGTILKVFGNFFEVLFGILLWQKIYAIELVFILVSIYPNTLK